MAAETQNVNQDSNSSGGLNLSRNPISLAGMALAVVAFLNILFLFFLDAFSHAASPYVGILAYMVAPAFLVLGLLMIPIGIVIERRRRHHSVGDVTKYGELDLNNPAQRSTVAFRAQFSS